MNKFDNKDLIRERLLSVDLDSPTDCPHCGGDHSFTVDFDYMYKLECHDVEVKTPTWVCKLCGETSLTTIGASIVITEAERLNGRPYIKAMVENDDIERHTIH